MPQRYNVRSYFASGTSWRSYFWWGGPGETWMSIYDPEVIPQAVDPDCECVKVTPGTKPSTPPPEAARMGEPSVLRATCLAAAVELRINPRQGGGYEPPTKVQPGASTGVSRSRPRLARMPGAFRNSRKKRAKTKDITLIITT